MFSEALESVRRSVDGKARYIPDFEENRRYRFRAALCAEMSRTRVSGRDLGLPLELVSLSLRFGKTDSRMTTKKVKKIRGN